MPRPRKSRKVCSMPDCTQFGPFARQCCHAVIMNVDEYETIRLIDLEGLTQDQCAKQMEVARTTVQAIYSSARKKLAECIVHGHNLKIVGGDVKLCEHNGQRCNHCCAKRSIFLKEEDAKYE